MINFIRSYYRELLCVLLIIAVYYFQWYGFVFFLVLAYLINNWSDLKLRIVRSVNDIKSNIHYGKKGNTTYFYYGTMDSTLNESRRVPDELLKSMMVLELDARFVKLNKNQKRDRLAQSFRELAKQYHPDMNRDASAEDDFKEINAANKYLKEYFDL